MTRPEGIFIPARIARDKSLTPLERLFLGEIVRWMPGGGCRQTNAYFAKKFGVEKENACRMLQALLAKKRITTTFLRAEYGKERVIKIAGAD